MEGVCAGNGSAVKRNESSGMGAGCDYADLLSEYGAYSELEAIPSAGCSGGRADG